MGKKFSGVAVQEIEGKARRYAVEIVVSLMFALTAIFSLIWDGSMLTWAIVLFAVLGIVGVWFAHWVDKLCSSVLNMAFRDKFVSITFIIIICLCSVFVPIVSFAVIGLMAGKAFHFHSSECGNSSSKKFEEHSSSEQKSASFDQKKETVHEESENHKNDNHEDIPKT